MILRNLEEGRELLDGLYGLDPDSNAFTPSLTVEDYRQMYEIKWRELEPVLRAYYQ